MISPSGDIFMAKNEAIFETWSGSLAVTPPGVFNGTCAQVGLEPQATSWQGILTWLRFDPLLQAWKGLTLCQKHPLHTHQIILNMAAAGAKTATGGKCCLPKAWQERRVSKKWPNGPHLLGKGGSGHRGTPKFPPGSNDPNWCWRFQPITISRTRKRQASSLLASTYPQRIL